MSTFQGGEEDQPEGWAYNTYVHYFSPINWVIFRYNFQRGEKDLPEGWAERPLYFSRINLEIFCYSFQSGEEDVPTFHQLIG